MPAPAAGLSSKTRVIDDVLAALGHLQADAVVGAVVALAQGLELVGVEVVGVGVVERAIMRLDRRRSSFVASTGS